MKNTFNSLIILLAMTACVPAQSTNNDMSSKMSCGCCKDMKKNNDATKDAKPCCCKGMMDSSAMKMDGKDKKPMCDMMKGKE